jgi:hypothetical protein
VLLGGLLRIRDWINEGNLKCIGMVIRGETGWVYEKVGFAVAAAGGVCDVCGMKTGVVLYWFGRHGHLRRIERDE